MEVELVSVWPATVSSEDRLTVEILVRNVGKNAILIPASKDLRRVEQPANRDQRVLLVQLQFTHRKAEEGLDIVFGGACGSSSVPDSMISLAPQETVLIHTEERPYRTSKWREQDLPSDSVAVKATITEVFFTDDHHEVAVISAVKSRNSLEVLWKR